MNKFWNFAEGDSGGRTLFLNGEISDESWYGDEVTPGLFKDELTAGEGDITVWINSPGGDVFAAAQIYNMLKDYAGKVTVRIDSLAASAASFIAMAGDEVYMSPVAMMMIHNPSTVAFGEARDMEKAITMLNEVKESILNAYEAKTHLSRTKLAHLMDDESWFNAKKAVELGFADGILYENDASIGSEVTDSVIFSRRAVNNALANKLEKHYGKQRQSVKDKIEIPDPCVGCFGAAQNDCEHCEKRKVNNAGQTTGMDNGRSADELRERLSFIKKFI